MNKNKSIKPDISVVIPSFKPGVLLGPCLDSVLGQTLAASKQIIVVDSSPVPIPEAFRRRYPAVSFVHLDRQTLPGRARNIGAAMAKGRVIFFTDTDCVADPLWMETLWEAHEAGYPAAGGSVVNGTPDSYVGTAEYLLEFNEVNPRMRSREVRALPSNNLSVNRRAFESLGGFPDFMKGEDTIFCDRLVTAGGKILFVPGARILHRNRTAFRRFLANQVALGEGSLETRRRTRRHGYFLVQWPPLVGCIPAYRTAAIGRRLLGSSLRLFFQYLAHYPLILLGMAVYTWGFIRGPHRSGLSTEKRLPVRNPGAPDRTSGAPDPYFHDRPSKGRGL
jgi:GT2 family glycosyltransferase